MTTRSLPRLTAEGSTRLSYRGPADPCPMSLKKIGFQVSEGGRKVIDGLPHLAQKGLEVAPEPIGLGRGAGPFLGGSDEALLLQDTQGVAHLVLGIAQQFR